MVGGVKKKTAERMLDELLFNYLEVVLIPAREQRHANHMIRAVQYRNADWYREFCDLYQSSRSKPKRSSKSDTRIKREHTINALERIISGEEKGVYIERLLDFIGRKEREQLNRQKRRQIEYDYFAEGMRF